MSAKKKVIVYENLIQSVTILPSLFVYLNSSIIISLLSVIDVKFSERERKKPII